jgi:hypothetical protein
MPIIFEAPSVSYLALYFISSSNVNLYSSFSTSTISSLLPHKPLPKLLRQRQLPRRGAHIYRFGCARDNPVLGDRIPIRDIAACDLIGELLSRASVDENIVKASEDDFWVVGATERDVLYCG